MSTHERDAAHQSHPSTGRLVIRRTDRPGRNKLALMLADSVDRQAPVGAILGTGIEVEVLEISTDGDGAPVAHLGVMAGPEVRIEREERLSGTRVGRAPTTEVDVLKSPDGEPDTMDLAALEAWLVERKREMIQRDAEVRRVRDAVRKAHGRGYARPSNDGHIEFEILKNEQRVLTEQREALKERMARGAARVKELRRQRSEARLAGFHASFYKAARAALPAEQFEALTNAAAGSEDT